MAAGRLAGVTNDPKPARPTPTEIADKLLGDLLEGEGHLPAWRAHQLIVQAIEDERRSAAEMA